jgi:hypothetical protein
MSFPHRRTAGGLDDLLEKAQELAVGRAWLAGVGDDPACDHLQGGERRGRAMTLVIAGMTFCLIETLELIGAVSMETSLISAG